MEKTTQVVAPYDDVEEEESEFDKSPHELPKKRPRKKKPRDRNPGALHGRTVEDGGQP